MVCAIFYKLYVLLGCSPAFVGALVVTSLTTMTGLDRSVMVILLGCTLVQIYFSSRILNFDQVIVEHRATFKVSDKLVNSTLYSDQHDKVLSERS